MSSQIQQNQRESINAFKRYIPSLLPYAFSQAKSNISIFCNKAKELNIVDYNSGQTFYGNKPLTEVTAQVNKVAQQADLVNLNTGQWTQRALPISLDALVVFGIGAGYHIQQLIERYDIKHLIIYPFLKNSVLLCPALEFDIDVPRCVCRNHKGGRNGVCGLPKISLH